MNTLEQLISKKIKTKGPIPFEAFMEMALYYPELGYYSSPEITIGTKGDFYTSPHLHPAFGGMIAKQLIEMWEKMRRPAEFHAVEMGAGLGYLCRDIFDYLNKTTQDINDFLNAFQYVIVEPFEHFKEHQKKLLKEASNRVRWTKSLNELSDLNGCILSNELLDAFPVHLVEMDDELKEIHLNLDGEEFVEEKRGLSSEGIKEYIKEFSIDIPRGYRTEINLRIKDWLRDAGQVLKEGFILTVDYGYTNREYYIEERSTGTLLCYHKHLFNETPYTNIGKQDITAHVNFTSLKKWGEEMGLKTIGYAPQGTFLTAAGIDELIIELYEGSPDYLKEIAKIKGLIFPQGMGASHNVMVQYKGDGLPELRGFSMRNLIATL